MERLVRQFLWGGKAGKSGVALVPWETVQKPLDQAKYNWVDVVPLSIQRRGCSRLWTGLSNIWEDLKECISWDIRDGRDTDFWYDHWLGKDNRLAFSCTILSSPRPARVADMVTNDGLWDWDRIGSSLPRIALDRIASVPPPRTGLGGYFPVWRWEDKRGFTTRSAYAFLVLDSGTHYPAVWRRIWKLVVPQRVQVFVWVTLHERLLTNAERVRRHFANSELCGICGGAREDMEHVLRSCAMAKGLWLRLIPSASRVSFFSLTFKEWFCTNLFEGSFVSNDDEWSNRFAIMCWLLWKRRCRLLFEENVGVLDDVLVTGNRLLMQTRDAFTMLVGSYARCAVVRLWSRQPPGWVKMNVDASVSIADQTAGVGGAIRDDIGSWRFGFARFVGRCNALLAELWAIHDGLLHTWELGYLRVELESDCLEAVRIVNCQSNEWGGSALVISIRRLLAADWDVVVRHISRDMNKVADSLAQRGRELRAESSAFYLPPEGTISLVIQEQGASGGVTGLPAREAPVVSGAAVGIG
ncbi:hypothetical protein GQ457_14G003440 [Hibiscus cannabinus]